MFKFVILTGLLTLLPRGKALSCGRKRKTDWDYRAKGPGTWPKIAPQCKGANQSPINIETNGKLIKGNYKNYINETNYVAKPKVKKYTMVNNGHTLEIKLPANTSYELRKGENVYVPITIHIYFDSIDRQGSEHMINGMKYFAEIQVVHRNRKYKVEDICRHPDLQTNGILILAMFVDIEKEESNKRTLYGFEQEYRAVMGVETSLAMDIISSGSEKISNSGEKTKIDAFPLSWLLPQTERLGAIYDYVNYHGSISTPPCYEIVDWIVFTGKTLLAGETTRKKMFKVRDGTGNKMSGCNRPVQDLNGRKVYGVKGDFKNDV